MKVVMKWVKYVPLLFKEGTFENDAKHVFNGGG